MAEGCEYSSQFTLVIVYFIHYKQVSPYPYEYVVPPFLSFQILKPGINRIMAGHSSCSGWLAT